MESAANSSVHQYARVLAGWLIAPINDQRRIESATEVLPEPSDLFTPPTSPVPARASMHACVSTWKSCAVNSNSCYWVRKCYRNAGGSWDGSRISLFLFVSCWPSFSGHGVYRYRTTSISKTDKVFSDNHRGRRERGGGGGRIY
jgi:hypothetical protein